MCPEIEFGYMTFSDPGDIANAFAHHFENVYNSNNNDSFNSDVYYNIENSYKSMKTANIISKNLIPGGEVTIDKISQMIRDLELRKAPGIGRIQNEHVIHGGLELKLCILHLFNSIIKIGQIPDSWKKDIIVPIHKGSNKPKKSPDSYRPIALLPCFLKIFEKLLLLRTKTYVLSTGDFPNPQQQGFQPKLGCLTASFNLQETICHNLELGSPVYVAFLDTSIRHSVEAWSNVQVTSPGCFRTSVDSY